MQHERLNAYRVMWLFVFFDLPTNTKKERRAAAGFRKKLQKDGFTMMQYSVYTRHCASRESTDVHIKRINSFLTDKGKVSVASFTDKQYSNITNYWGKSEKPPLPIVNQLEIF